MTLTNTFSLLPTSHQPEQHIKKSELPPSSFSMYYGMSDTHITISPILQFRFLPAVCHFSLNSISQLFYGFITHQTKGLREEM